MEHIHFRPWEKGTAGKLKVPNPGRKGSLSRVDSKKSLNYDARKQEQQRI